MATVAEFTVRADAFPLGELFAAFPDATVELEQVVPTTPALVPYVWVAGLDEAELSELLAYDRNQAVSDIERIDRIDDQHLLRLDWDPEYHGILRGVVEMDGTLLSGTGTAEQWTFEVRSDSGEGITQLQDYCHGHDIPISLAAIHGLGPTESEAKRELTDPQRAALVLAYEQDYYDSPRGVTLAELATEMDITGQALGSRLRRGVRRLIGQTLVDEE